MGNCAFCSYISHTRPDPIEQSESLLKNKTQNKTQNDDDDDDDDDDDELFFLFRSIRAMIRPVNPSSTRT